MLRPELLLHSQRVPVTPLNAATLLLLRDRADGGWEVLMTRRSDKASFVPGAYVFPGGGIEAQDMQAHAQVQHREDMSAEALTAAIAAVRETMEEMGVLLAVHANGRAATQTDVDALDRMTPLWPQLANAGLQLDVRAVWQIAHWTADRNLPRRFAVPFFVARMPEGQTPVADESEQFEPVWVNPQEALDRYQCGQMPMIFPTLRTLERLTRYPTAQAVLDAV
ncbi:MAG: NUDIX hydrolase, partial [Comamonas sp.]